MDGDLITDHGDIISSKVEESCDESNACSVDDVPTSVQDMNRAANAPDLLSTQNTKGFGVNRPW